MVEVWCEIKKVLTKRMVWKSAVCYLSIEIYVVEEQIMIVLQSKLSQKKKKKKIQTKSQDDICTPDCHKSPLQNCLTIGLNRVKH